MKVLLTLHVIAAIFLVGPLIGAGMTGIRAARTADPGGLRACARMISVYGWASLAVPILGASMVQGEDKGWHFSFGEAWIISSLALFVVAFVLTIAVLSPAVRHASTLAETGAIGSSTIGRIAASGGLITLAYLAITVLMIYQPGS